MITKKTEDGGGRFSILNLAASEKNLTYKITDVETKVLPYETRTKYLDVARGKYFKNLFFMKLFCLF